CWLGGAKFQRFRWRSTSPLAFLATTLAALISGCVGLTGPATLSATPSAITFGDIEVGTTGAQTLNLSNSGATSLTVSEASVSGAGFEMIGQAFPLTLAPGQSSALTLKFAPTATSSATGSLSLTSNASISPIRFALSGRGVRHRLTVVPSIVNFGNMSIGASSSQAITVTNSGTRSLSISKGIIVGTGFSMSGLSIPLTLAPGQSGQFEVQFAPTSVGSVSGSLSLVSSATDSPSVVALSGTGERGALAANPLSVNFGNILVGANKSSTVTLTNSGTVSLT